MRKPFEGSLAILEVLLVVVENQPQVGEAEQRKRAQMGHARDAVHRDFERNRDLLLDLFGGDSRPLGDDLNVIVGHVGIGFNGKSVKRDDSRAHQQERESQHEGAFVEGKVDYPADHLLFHRALEDECARHHLVARLQSRNHLLQVAGEHASSHHFLAPEAAVS